MNPEEDYDQQTPEPDPISPNPPLEREIEEVAPITNTTKVKNYSVISFVLSIIPIVIWTLTIIWIVPYLDRIKSPGFSGGMSVIILPMFYYAQPPCIGAVASYFSIRYAIKGLKIKEQYKLAIASLVLKGITVVLIIATFVILA